MEFTISFWSTLTLFGGISLQQKPIIVKLDDQHVRTKEFITHFYLSLCCTSFLVCVFITFLSLSPPLSHSHSLSVSLFLCLSLTLSVSLTHSLPLSPTLSLSLSLTLFHTLPLTHTLSLSSF